MSHLIQVEMDDDDGVRQRLSDDDIRAFMVLLATAGNETVTKLLATVFHELWRNPEQRTAVLRAGALRERDRGDAALRPAFAVPGSRHHTRDDAARVTIPAARESAADQRRNRSRRAPIRRSRPLRRASRDRRSSRLRLRPPSLHRRMAGAPRVADRVEEFLRRWPRYEVPEDGVERMHSSNVRGLSGLVIEPVAPR